jgi:diguanylate cyclase (GGDEF)-like protein
MPNRFWRLISPKKVAPTIFDEAIRTLIAGVLGVVGVWLLGKTSLLKDWLHFQFETVIYALLLIIAICSLIGFFIGRISLRKKILDLASRASQDILTGLLNNREFIERIPKEIARSKRYNHKLSLILLDIDEFKRINDSYSYDGGDSVLKQFANFLLGEVRKSDFVFRYKQGDEFVLLLPSTELEGARHVAERMRSTLLGYNFQVRADKVDERITLSAGVVTLNLKEDESTESLLKRAETALAHAKLIKNVIVTH